MTNWLAYLAERQKFRRMMRGLSQAKREELAFLDVTKAIQNKEGLDYKQARIKLHYLIECRRRAA